MSVDECAARSRELLRACVGPRGLVASADFAHYGVVWARDAAVSGLGALASGDEELVAAVADTLDLLAETASPHGQIPAVVDARRGTRDFGEGGAVDPTPWFVILAGEYVDRTGDVGTAERWWSTIDAGMAWMACQDVTGSGLVSAAPSTDWMDAALTRSGRTLHLNVLYCWAARHAARLARTFGARPRVDPDDLRRRIDLLFWPTPDRSPAELHDRGFIHGALPVAYWEAAQGDRRHFVSHVVHAAIVDRLDALANVLAILVGIVDADRAIRVLDALDELAVPYPTRSLDPPVRGADPDAMWIRSAEHVIPERWRNLPGRYHNGAVWPYIGALHAAAAAAAGDEGRARVLLGRVAQANRLGEDAPWGFHEWIDVEARPRGATGQAWNAGAFLFAWERVRGR